MSGSSTCGASCDYYARMSTASTDCIIRIRDGCQWPSVPPRSRSADGCHLPDASGVFEHQPLSACRSQHGLVCGQHLVQRRGELLGLGIAKGKRQRGEAAPRHDHTAPQQRLVSVERKA